MENESWNDSLNLLNRCERKESSVKTEREHFFEEVLKHIDESRLSKQVKLLKINELLCKWPQHFWPEIFRIWKTLGRPQFQYINILDGMIALLRQRDYKVLNDFKNVVRRLTAEFQMIVEQPSWRSYPLRMADKGKGPFRIADVNEEAPEFHANLHIGECDRAIDVQRTDRGFRVRRGPRYALHWDIAKKNIHRFPRIGEYFMHRIADISKDSIYENYRWAKKIESEGNASQLLLSRDKGVANDLIERLANCKPGQMEWRIYQDTVADILEYTLIPPLEGLLKQVSTANGSQRRDILLRIPFGIGGFWGYLQDRFKSIDVIVDCKNYVEDLQPSELWTMTKYLHKLGKLCLVIARRRPTEEIGKEAAKIYRSQGKLFVFLCDDDLKAMIESKTKNLNPAAVVEKHVRGFFEKLSP